MTAPLASRCYLVARPRYDADWPDDPRDFSNLEYRADEWSGAWLTGPGRAHVYATIYSAACRAGAVIESPQSRVVLADHVETPGTETIELVEGTLLDRARECVIRIEGGFVDDYYNGVTLDQARVFGSVDEAVQWLGDRRVRWVQSIHNIRRATTPATVTITPVEILR